MKKNNMKKRLMILLVSIMALALAMPMAAYAAPPPDVPSGSTLTIEYRFVKGETPNIPATITQFGMTYRLISQSAPVLESTLPQTRTYTYNISGRVKEEQLDDVLLLGDEVEVTAVDIPFEREVDVIDIQRNLRTNDVDDIPLTKTFRVTSAETPNGFINAVLERTGVTFDLADPPLDEDGLPAGYVATVVYRGLESYLDLGYYLVTAVIESLENDDDVEIYVIIAEYQTDEMPPPIDIGDEEAPLAGPDAGAGAGDGTGGTGADSTGTILDGGVPLGGFNTAGGWSLLSLLFSVGGGVIAAAYGIGALAWRRRIKVLEELGVYDEGWLAAMKRRGRLLRALTVLLGIIVPVTWALLDNFSQGVVWINNHTLAVSVLFALTIIFCVLTNAQNSKVTSDDSEEEYLGTELNPA